MKELGATAITTAVLLALTLAPSTLFGQSSATADASAQKGRLSFDVASVKIDNAGLPPDGPLQSFKIINGYLSAVNAPLIGFISFAYNLKNPPKGLPGWALGERLDVQAKASGRPTDDQIRLMIQGLLADRFKFAAHYEQREVPVYDLVLSKPGRLGSRLRPFEDEEPCPSTAPPMGSAVAGGYPARCGGPPEPLSSSQAGLTSEGGRNVSIEQLCGWIRIFGHLDRPVSDRTGLRGNYDFVIEWDSKASDPQFDSTGTSFIEALQDQLGLKLDATTGPETMLVIDHIEQPSPN